MTEEVKIIFKHISRTEEKKENRRENTSTLETIQHIRHNKSIYSDKLRETQFNFQTDYFSNDEVLEKSEILKYRNWIDRTIYYRRDASIDKIIYFRADNSVKNIKLFDENNDIKENQYFSEIGKLTKTRYY